MREGKADFYSKIGRPPPRSSGGVEDEAEDEDEKEDGLLGTSVEEFEETWRIAALGAFVAARETAPEMVAAGKAR